MIFYLLAVKDDFEEPNLDFAEVAVRVSFEVAVRTVDESETRFVEKTATRNRSSDP